MTVVLESATNTAGTVDTFFATSGDLLGTIAEVLDVRTILPRLSEIANRILPHDALAMGSIDPAGQLVFEAATADLPDLRAHALETPFREDIIIGDLTAQEVPVVRGMSAAPKCAARGYRSLLTTVTRTGDLVLGVGFWSKHPYAYERGHLPLARRILEHIAVAVSHEQLATVAREAAGGRARASELDPPVRSLLHELGTGARSRVVGES